MTCGNILERSNRTTYNCCSFQRRRWQHRTKHRHRQLVIITAILFGLTFLNEARLCHGLQTNRGGSSFSASSSSSSCINPEEATTSTSTARQLQSLLHQDDLAAAIRYGRVYQHDHFLTEPQVQYLLDEIDVLQENGQFVTKGLSNTADPAQRFSAQQDRAICPVPWFVDALRSQPTTTAEQQQQQTTTKNEEDRHGIPSKLQQLQLELSTLLNRPSMADATLNHECYYSLSNVVGSFLPRHMDERHEELKGVQGWLLPSRRSLSWLIYLSEPADWDIKSNGGALRTFPQRRRRESVLASLQQQQQQQEEHIIAGSTHDGNLQVGWIRDDEQMSQPVYLDSFHRPPPNVSSQDPYCILYSIRQDGSREYITKPWLMEALQGLPIPEFLQACAELDAASNNDNNSLTLLLLFTSSVHAQRFHLIENRQAWNDGRLPEGSVVEDIAPVRGRLVVFDSVQLPHEVQAIKSGTRRALAGWFHEKTQELAC